MTKNTTIYSNIIFYTKGSFLSKVNILFSKITSNILSVKAAVFFDVLQTLPFVMTPFLIDLLLDLNKKIILKKLYYFFIKTPFASKANSFLGTVILAISSLLFPASSA